MTCSFRIGGWFLEPYSRSRGRQSDDARRPGFRPSRTGATPGGARHRGHGDRHRRSLTWATVSWALFNAAKNKHQQQFRASGKAINAKVRLFGRIGLALIEWPNSPGPRSVRRHRVLRHVLGCFRRERREKIAQPEDLICTRIGESYARRDATRRNSPRCSSCRCAAAKDDVLDAIGAAGNMNSDNARRSADAPTGFHQAALAEKLVMTDTGIDRRYYELCALSEMKNALRSGDIWCKAPASSGFRGTTWCRLRIRQPQAGQPNCCQPWPPIATSTCMSGGWLLETCNCHRQRWQLTTLPDAIITESGLKNAPLDAVRLPDTAQALIDQRR